MNIRTYYWSKMTASERNVVLERSGSDIRSRIDAATEIVQTVESDGDEALYRYTSRFDGVSLEERGLRVTESEFDRAVESLAANVRSAIDYAIENVRAFHRAQQANTEHVVSVRPGIKATERYTPIEKVGLYVPRGRGSFPSMLYMLAVPASLALVPRIVVATPPCDDGTVDGAVLYAARRCGIDEVYRVGGAHAIAALTVGTETIPAVYKIVGPGSAWVAAAKRVVSDRVDVGLPAGPSESIIIADSTADPWRVALDLMIEAEHGSDSSALLVTNDLNLVENVVSYVGELLDEVPEPRKRFVSEVLSGYGGIVVVEDIDQGIDFVNAFAPEHLLLHVDKPYKVAARITNASEILIGPNTAFSLANYATGPNAVLPTGGWARSHGPVSVRDFVKYASLIEVTDEGYREMRDHVIALADYEGFYTHAAALRRRDR